MYLSSKKCTNHQIRLHLIEVKVWSILIFMIPVETRGKFLNDMRRMNDLNDLNDYWAVESGGEMLRGCPLGTEMGTTGKYI